MKNFYTLVGRTNTKLLFLFFLSIIFKTNAQNITGSGTVNYIPKFTNASSIGNSIIYDTNGLIGIGTTVSTPKTPTV